MRSVLGIDAAWTITQPSGVALAAGNTGGWQLITAAASYDEFLGIAGPDARPTGSAPDVDALLQVAQSLVGARPDLVTIDMPMAHSPIVARREADNAVSRAYGGRKCGTHTPSAVRPGQISDELRAGFEVAGYPLCTEAICPPGLIEVYPHPALVELTQAAERLPYKAAKIRNYWRADSVIERRIRLYAQWAAVVEALELQIAGVAAVLQPVSSDASGVQLKAYEDKLDAVVCAWVAICALEGRALPFGDADAAIWIPR